MLLVAYDGEEGDVDAHVAPALVGDVDREALDDEAGRRVDIALPYLHEMGRRSSVLVGPLDGWWVASKGLGPLPRRRGFALAQGCGRGDRVVLLLPRAAALSTGLRVPA